MMRESDLNDATVQQAVRDVAGEYLQDPNINSVGVGYKQTGGERTDELVLQFTVGQKMAPEALAAATTQAIPEKIEKHGITFATDVVERSFEPHRVLAPPRAERERRHDPMTPGISIAHVDVTAGTLGCFVQENGTGRLRVLSNWHVLDGGAGDVGDPISQPGSLDDPRVSDNFCGRLVRSHLGLEGDCAIASVFGRAVDPTILALGTTVTAVGEAALGDRVVKSGRTTGVTYGIVTRVHTISKLSYPGAGTKQIGGFEIGPDDAHPAADGEISMGGDSGSAWMAVDDHDAALGTMVGLHFAGETAGAEFALACNATAVFAALDISPLPAPPLAVEAARESAPSGYDPDFLPGVRIDAPVAAQRAVQDDIAPTELGSPVRHYTHFSLAMSAERRFCRWVAWNIDGNGLIQLSRTGVEFVIDRQYASKFQVDNALYSGNRLDRGHIARRADLLWGSREEAEQANVDSFFFTNITPQLDDFNQSSKHGLWGELEDAVFEDVDVDDLRVSVFGGPIFKDSDLLYRDVLVPRSFWKAIAYVESGELKAKAFVLTQDDLEAKLESLGLEEFNLFQVTLRELGEMTGLSFPSLDGADTMPPSPEGAGGAPVRRIERRSDIAA